MSLVCNRLNITGDISERTPLIVIQEIASAHRIHYLPERCNDPNYIRGMNKKIHETAVYRIPRPFIIRDRELLLRYLGASQEAWTLEELELVCNYWENLTNQLNSSNNALSVNIEHIGQVTRNCPRSLNACFLYRICKNKGIELPFNITLEQLGCIVKLSSDRINSAIEILNAVILRGNPNEILPLIGLIPNSYLTSRIPPRSFIPPEEVEVITYDSLLELSSQGILSNKDIRKNFNPRNNREAIALASCNYGVNLFYASNPVKEYYAILLVGISKYEPVDPAMKQIYEKNPNLIYTRVFEPRIPLEFYTKGLLTAVENEGYLRDNLRESPYELLQMAYVSETFHMGWFPNIGNTETPFNLEEVNQLNSEDLICFGCRADNLVALDIAEITAMLSQNSNFRNNIPGFRGFFSDIAIRKLRLICQYLGTVKSTECFREIDAIESLISTASENLNKFAKAYAVLDLEQQNCIQVVLKNLLELSMYMRGWDGVSPETYPIVKAPVDNQNIVDVRVTEAIYKFETSMDSSPLKNQIRVLPLIKYDHGRFTVSNDTENGRTLGERINIMKRGENANNINSCIRLSSNWFAASCYRYHQVIKLPVPFEIENLRYIM